VAYLKAVINEKKSQGQFVVFSPQSTELFLDEPDLTITYSAYQGWFNPKKMRVIPHLWTPVRPVEYGDPLRWTSKPPLRIGFMGRHHRTSRLATFAMKFPTHFRHWLLQGAYLKHPRIVGLTNDLGLSITAVNAFARMETVSALKTHKNNHDLELDIVEKARFDGSRQELADYANHLDRNTYIVCPRGTENYSFRIYETLSRGRIPVIIDTDVVLPKELNWDRLSIRVPYESLGFICDIIMKDYQSRSGPEFMERQQEALSTMAELRTMRWVKDLANEMRTVISMTVRSSVNAAS
jgi:Exostosin family